MSNGNLAISTESNPLTLNIVSSEPTYIFVPQPDITAYELARCMTYVLTHMSRGLADEPENVRRHWREVT